MLKKLNGEITPQEYIEIGGQTYDYTVSHDGYMIEREGVQYGSAVDPLGSNRLYNETNVSVEPVENE